MKKKILRGSLLTTTMIAGVLVGTAASAQTTDTTQTAPAESTDATPPANANGGTGDIVVTGSRISNPNLTSASPISVVTAQDIQIRGGSRIEDVLNTLPQSFATQTSSVSNGSTGTATLNLRNLGDQRTLVLVNGRRLMPGDPVSKSSAADVNVIPQALISG